MRWQLWIILLCGLLSVPCWAWGSGIGEPITISPSGIANGRETAALTQPASVPIDSVEPATLLLLGIGLLCLGRATREKMAGRRLISEGPRHGQAYSLPAVGEGLLMQLLRRRRT